MAIARFESVDIDCPNDVELRAFYQRLTGLEEEPLGDFFPSLRDPRGFWIRFQEVKDYAPPTWPSQERGQQFHLDFQVSDLEAGVQRALDLGATLAPEQPGEGWRVMLDPVGHPFCLSPGEVGGDVARLTMVTMDVPDAGVAGRFYETLTGWSLQAGDGYFGVAEEGGLMLGGQQVENYQPPTWPTQARGQQMHMDFLVDDIESAVQQAIKAGATRSADQPGTDEWAVMLDPAGHPFCLTTG